MKLREVTLHLKERFLEVTLHLKGRFLEVTLHLKEDLWKFLGGTVVTLHRKEDYKVLLVSLKNQQGCRP